MKTFKEFLEVRDAAYQAWLDKGGYQIKKQQTPENLKQYQEPLNDLMRAAAEIGGRKLQNELHWALKPWAKKVGILGMQLVSGVIE